MLAVTFFPNKFGGFRLEFNGYQYTVRYFMNNYLEKTIIK